MGPDRVMRQGHMARQDDAEFVGPPPSEGDGSPFWVDIRLNLLKVGTIDTVSNTAFAQIAVVYYWSDPRLKGYPEDIELPPSLWGPRLVAENYIDCSEEDLQFELVDRTTGRLKRVRVYAGSLDNPMDLRSFPFDFDDVSVDWRTASNWSSASNEQTGSKAKGRVYRLRRVQEGAREGTWLGLSPWWDGSIAEWTLHGASTRITEKPASSTGSEVTTLSLSFYVSRKSGYYFFKVMMPLYVLIFLTVGTFHYGTASVSDRYDSVMTTFLAAFAMLYVVSVDLPKTDFLTKIDKIIVVNLIFLGATALTTVVIADVHARSGEDVANHWNKVLEVIFVALYVLVNVIIFVPAFIKKRRTMSRLDTSREAITINPVTQERESNGSYYAKAVKTGHDYYTLEDIEQGKT
eukprot:SAG31_NODE_3714_length_3957_cov_3.388025_4_plen_405_part_00